MTIMTDDQEKLIEAVKAAYDSVVPVLGTMHEDYEYAVYIAKKPIRDAVDAAIDGRVPMSRIVEGATDMRYAQKLKLWLQPHEAVVERVLASGEPQLPDAGAYVETINTIATVTRSPTTGVFAVTYEGSEYHIPAFGPDDAAWATIDESVPAGVYELIRSRYPDFEAIVDDEEDGY